MNQASQVTDADMNLPHRDDLQTRARITRLEAGTYLRSSEHILARQHTGAGQAFSRRAGGAECAALRK